MYAQFPIYKHKTYFLNIYDTHTANNGFGKQQLSATANKNEIFLKDVKVCGGTVF